MLKNLVLKILFLILKGLKEKYEKHHGVIIEDDILKLATDLSHKYLSSKKLPDKAIDVIDEAGSAVNLNRKNQKKVVIGSRDIENVVADIAKVPNRRIQGSEKQKLKHLERDLKMLIYGQDEAIHRIVDAIIVSRSGLREEGKPIANFLFAGPTGVGKTETAKQLANILGISFIRFDMSEYAEKHSIAKFIGSPPGYVGHEEGGLLTIEVSKNPYAVVLLDEIEKAHGDIYNLLLQVMDAGRLTDSSGKETDFRNTVIIMTSNAGASESESGSIGLESKNHHSRHVKRDQAIKRLFSPEFRNRLDSIIYFNGLDSNHLNMIVNKFLSQLENQLMEKNIEIEFDESCVKYLMTEGFDSKLGARPIARLIEDKIKKILAKEILYDRIQSGSKIFMFIKNSKIKFKINEKEFVDCL